MSYKLVELPVDGVAGSLSCLFSELPFNQVAS